MPVEAAVPGGLHATRFIAAACLIRTTYGIERWSCVAARARLLRSKTASLLHIRRNFRIASGIPAVQVGLHAARFIAAGRLRRIAYGNEESLSAYRVRVSAGSPVPRIESHAGWSSRRLLVSGGRPLPTTYVTTNGPLRIAYEFSPHPRHLHLRQPRGLPFTLPALRPRAALRSPYARPVRP